MERGKISPENSDIDNFLSLVEGLNKDSNTLEKMRKFLSKFSVTEVFEQTNKIGAALWDEFIEDTPASKELFYIKDGISALVGGERRAKEIIEDFIKKSKERRSLSLTEINDIVKETIKTYHISGDVDENIVTLSDYFQRLKQLDL